MRSCAIIEVIFQHGGQKTDMQHGRWGAKNKSIAGVEDRGIREVKFGHGAAALILLAIVMFICVVGLGTPAHIPLVCGCALAGGIALYLGYSWNDVLDMMVKGIGEALEAVLILMAIGMLVGVWIQSGTVPTMIYYGLKVVNSQTFLPLAFLVTLATGIVLGSWGAASTIGIAFAGIAAALDISLAMTAGAVVAGAYVSEIISPLVDGPNLVAAIASCDVFSLCTKFLPICAVLCILCVGLYAFAGINCGAALPAANFEQINSLLCALKQSYRIGPLALIPFVVMMVCMVCKVPALPAFLVSTAAGSLVAIGLQGSTVAQVIEVANMGALSQTGFENLDVLLSNGGIQAMMNTISIVILVMAYGGILQHTGLMNALVGPLISRVKTFGQLSFAAVLSGAALNVILPDQYPAITLSAQMYRDKFRSLGVQDSVWANIINSSAGIISPLIPWNTCAVYMTTVLGVSCAAYAPYAFFCYLYPVAVMVFCLAIGTKRYRRVSCQCL